MKTIHVIIQGRVQGVYFRDYTRRQAQKLGLKGWVRNLPTGSVEATINGKEENLHKMIEWFHIGSPASQVTGVDTEEKMPTEEFSKFEIRY